jgi:hypothetical protein
LGTTYGEIIFKTAPASIGENYQGGIVAYIFQPIDPVYIAGEAHGLILAPYDQSTGIQWYNGTYKHTDATATALGTGNANTNTIVASQGEGSYAAKLCFDLELGGYSDWYLPSYSELGMIWQNQVAIFGLAINFYWSSSETSSDEAWNLDLSEVYKIWSMRDKSRTSYVRAIRSF